MTIYARAAIVIVATAAVIIVAGLTVGAYFLTDQMSDAIEKDMMVVVNVADKYVANEIRLLKIQAAEAAGKIRRAYEAGERPGVLERVRVDHPLFTGLTVFDGTTRVDSWGWTPEQPDFPGEAFMRLAGAGGQALSTTMHNPDGTLVMYVSAPVGDGLVLAAAFPGQYFSDLLSRFTVYQTGHLFIDDEKGHVIVNIRPEWVQSRINFIELAGKDGRFEELGALVRRGISGEQGTARFTVDGESRICAFRPLSSPSEPWFVGVIAPVSESPLKEVPGGMLLIGVISFGLSVVAALLAANLIKRPYERMDRLRKEAVIASKTKSDFLATMSHEIRTPLNAVIGLSELTMGEGSLTREAESNLEKIYNAGSTILNIINDILDISKIESGKFEICPVQYDTPSLINDIVTLNIVRIGEKNIAFKLSVDENLPGVLYGDDLRVKQVFNNLLSNAFKYTNSGTVEWRVSFERDGNGAWLVSSVRDTGIGIKPEDVRRLFSDYNQVDTKTNRRVGGAGLGLAIAKRLVSMMDGTIAVESEYGKGSTFHVRLRQTFASEAPIGKDVAENLAGLRYMASKRARDMRLARVNLSYAHVLVVDDIATNLDVMRGMLKPYKVKIDCAADGPQAIAMIRAGSPRYTAVFMDHMMPGMDGIEAARIIREEIGTDYARNIPILALTANAIVGNEEMFLNQGFQAFIPKPIDIMKLDSALRLWVRDRNREKELSEAGADAPPPETGNPGSGNGTSLLAGTAIDGIDRDRGVERFGGDEAVFVDVLRSYAVNTPPLLDSIRTVDRKDLAGYATTVHGIKGSSRNICAESVGTLAEALESAAKAGDFDFVARNNQAFLDAVRKLAEEIGSALDAMANANPKPRKARPDADLLSSLRAACDAYDLDGIDSAMERIEKYEYGDDDGLVAWLRESVTRMDFASIAEKLSPLRGDSGNMA